MDLIQNEEEEEKKAKQTKVKKNNKNSNSKNKKKKKQLKNPKKNSNSNSNSKKKTRKTNFSLNNAQKCSNKHEFLIEKIIEAALSESNSLNPIDHTEIDIQIDQDQQILACPPAGVRAYGFTSRSSERENDPSIGLLSGKPNDKYNDLFNSEFFEEEYKNGNATFSFHTDITISRYFPYLMRSHQNSWLKRMTPYSQTLILSKQPVPPSRFKPTECKIIQAKCKPNEKSNGESASKSAICEITKAIKDPLINNTNNSAKDSEKQKTEKGFLNTKTPDKGKEKKKEEEAVENDNIMNNNHAETTERTHSIESIGSMKSNTSNRRKYSHGSRRSLLSRTSVNSFHSPDSICSDKFMNTLSQKHNLNDIDKFSREEDEADMDRDFDLENDENNFYDKDWRNAFEIKNYKERVYYDKNSENAKITNEQQKAKEKERNKERKDKLKTPQKSKSKKKKNKNKQSTLKKQPEESSFKKDKIENSVDSDLKNKNKKTNKYCLESEEEDFKDIDLIGWDELNSINSELENDLPKLKYKKIGLKKKPDDELSAEKIELLEVTSALKNEIDIDALSQPILNKVYSSFSEEEPLEQVAPNSILNTNSESTEMIHLQEIIIVTKKEEYTSASTNPFEKKEEKLEEEFVSFLKKRKEGGAFQKQMMRLNEKTKKELETEVEDFYREEEYTSELSNILSPLEKTHKLIKARKAEVEEKTLHNTNTPQKQLKKPQTYDSPQDGPMITAKLAKNKDFPSIKPIQPNHSTPSSQSQTKATSLSVIELDTQTQTKSGEKKGEVEKSPALPQVRVVEGGSKRSSDRKLKKKRSQMKKSKERKKTDSALKEEEKEKGQTNNKVENASKKESKQERLKRMRKTKQTKAKKSRQIEREARRTIENDAQNNLSNLLPISNVIPSSASQIPKASDVNKEESKTYNLKNMKIENRNVYEEDKESMPSVFSSIRNSELNPLIKSSTSKTSRSPSSRSSKECNSETTSSSTDETLNKPKGKGNSSGSSASASRNSGRGVRESLNQLRS